MRCALFLLCFLLFSSLTSIQVKAQDKVFTRVEEEAVFPGGEDAMLIFLSKAINYPPVAIENGITGMVYVSFVINKNGSIEQCKIERDIGGGCGAEVIRAINSMPKWRAARVNGQTVRSYFTLPVRFEPPVGKMSRKERKAARKAKRNKK